MKRFLIFSGISVLVIIILGGIVLFYMRKQTKTFSPEETVSYNQNGLVINVFYNRPYKKGRQIFGGLVPYGKVWRTGANEATTLETNKNLNFNGKILKAGKYSIWTIPEEKTWTIIFNSVYGQWGINFDGEANREPTKDVVTIEVPVDQEPLEKVEQFTIGFKNTQGNSEMVLMWDKTFVSAPFTY